MLRYCLLFSIFFFLLTKAAQAQASYKLPPPRVPQALPPGSFYVAQVVDARAQPGSIGRVRQQMVSLPAVWEQDVPTTLQNFYNSNAPNLSGAVPLLLRVRALAVAEGPLATASLIADFYARRPDGSYRRLAYIAHRQQARPAFLTSAISQHPINLGDLLLGALVQGRTRRNWLADSTHYPAAYVLAPSLHSAEQLPVAAPDWQPRPGIYHTVEEFWHNAPSEPGRPEITAYPYHTAEWAADSQVTIARRLPSGQLEPVVRAWGFSDGRRLYVLHGRNYHSLTRRGAGFVFYGMAGDDPVYAAMANTKANTQAAGLGLASGLGLMANSGITSSSTSKRVLFSFDPLTGTASLDGAALAPPSAALPTQLYLYRARTAKGPAVRIALAGAGPPRELVVGDYLSFDVQAGQPVQLCVEVAGAESQCLPLTPVANITTYVEYQPGPVLPLRQVTTQTGAAALERLTR